MRTSRRTIPIITGITVTVVFTAAASAEEDHCWICDDDNPTNVECRQVTAYNEQGEEGECTLPEPPQVYCPEVLSYDCWGDGLLAAVDIRPDGTAARSDGFRAESPALVAVGAAVVGTPMPSIDERVARRNCQGIVMARVYSEPATRELMRQSNRITI